MVKTRALKINLAPYGLYLGRGEGCFYIRNMKTKEITEYSYCDNIISEAILT
jgi:hypothetical protein